MLVPFPIWRENFMPDASLAEAQAAHAKLNPHPYATFTDRISLSIPPAAMTMGKSYLYCTGDVAVPASLGWHPRMSERLGLFRFIPIPGGHEICFTDPEGLAKGILLAGRD